MSEFTNWKKQFTKIYIGQTFSILSSSAVQFSIIWWITIETGSAIALTIAGIVGLLPQAVIGLFAGVWVDRFNRKWVIITADTVIAASSLLLALAYFFYLHSLTLVYVVLFVRALGDTFHKPALQAAIPQLVPKEQLTRAGGFGQMVNSACSMAGPMLGALLMSVTTLGYVMIVDIVGAALAVIMLLGINIPNINKEHSEKTSLLLDMKQGLHAIWQNKVLVRISIPVLISTIVFVPLGILFPLMVKEHFLGNAWHNGLVQTLFSVGMLIGALIIGITGGFKKRFLMISLGVFMLGVSALICGILPGSMFWAFSIVVFVIGVTGMLFNIPYISYIQQSIPEQHLGKVLSLVTSIMSFAAPVGMIVAGPIAEKIGVNLWIFYIGIFMMMVGIFCYLLTRKYDVMDLVSDS